MYIHEGAQVGERTSALLEEREQIAKERGPLIGILELEQHHQRLHELVLHRCRGHDTSVSVC